MPHGETNVCCMQHSPNTEFNTHEQTFNFQPLAYITTPFVRKNGCPRQSLLSQHSIGFFDLPKENLALDLHAYSHLWIIFVFHQNRQMKHSEKTSCISTASGVKYELTK